MTMTSMEGHKIVRETTDWFRARAAQHYLTISDEHLDNLGDELNRILSHYVNDEAIQNTQYNPATNKVEEI